MRSGRSPSASSRTSPRPRRPRARTRWRRWSRALRGAPVFLSLLLAAGVAAALLLAGNWAWQVVRKPSELFFPVSGTLDKTPTETWENYAPIFRQHATATITAEFLAALAQVEGSGNPVVRTYWRLDPDAAPLDVWRPASSAVGMYQVTDGTFEEARRYCIHDHVVVEDGPWHDWRSCWFNALYTRVIPSHAVELTSAYLDRRVATTLARRGLAGASLARKQDLAAVIHLCGAAAGERFARRGFRFARGQRCGSHDARAYVARVDAMKAVFRRLAAAG